MKTYECTAYVHLAKKIKVKARNRKEAIERASKIAEERYGIGFNGSMSVPFYPEDFDK